MIVKVFIRRNFIRGTAAEILPLLKDLRAKALEQDGYISGETLIDPDTPRKTLIIGAWESLDKWQQWKNSGVRQACEAKLSAYQDRPTIYEVWVLGNIMASF